MAGERLRRVNEAIRQVLSGAVQDLKDPRVGFVTVTAVQTSPDLRHARVYASVLGDAEAREASLAGLRSAHGFLQRRVAGELRLKHTPTLEFVYDETAERAQRLTDLIDRETGR
jgi:ribosome-binding factor A